MITLRFQPVDNLGYGNKPRGQLPLRFGLLAILGEQVS